MHLIDVFNLRFLSKFESVPLFAFLCVLVGKIKAGAGKLYSLLAFFCCFVRDRALSFGAIAKNKK